MARWVTVMLVVLLAGIAPRSDAAAQYTVRHDVVGNGAVRSGDDVLRLRGTVGQTTLGCSMTFAYVAHAGFWYTLRTDSTATTGVGGGDPSHPVVHRLAQNYPNPAVSSTHLAFDLPARENVALDVFDVAGRRVATLVDEVLGPGAYVLDLYAEGWASGVYFYRLTTPTFSAVRKLLLLR